MNTVFSGDSKDGIADYVEVLGGVGPKVAAYIRISKKGQSDFSMDAQSDVINDLKELIKPSKIYWFYDHGKSSKSDKDFDKLKINKILKLKLAGEVTELWVFNVDRMGRVSRRLAHFYLEFSDDGGIIRTPEKVFGRDDLLDFVREADAAEKANRNRVKAVKAGTVRSFKLRHWNKRGEPLGYARKDEWLQKQPEFDPWVKKVSVVFHETKCLQSVCDRLGSFGGLLAEPLNTDQARRFLTDPVYIGKPERFGFVVIDEALAFIDEETRRKNLEILAQIQTKWRPKRRGPMEELAIYKPITYLQSVEVWEWHHRNCGGLVRKNGTTKDEGIWQQLYSCKKCGDGWRLPPINDGSSKLKVRSRMENYMGGLNFDNQSSTPINKRKLRKRNDLFGHEKLLKSEGGSHPTNGRNMGLDLQGHPVNNSPRRQKRKKTKKGGREIIKNVHDSLTTWFKPTAENTE